MAVTVKLGEKKVWKVNVGVASNGTRDHTKLVNRDAADQHPISSISGLEAALSQKAAAQDLKDHVDNKQNPHGMTAEQIGARPDTWIPTAGQIGTFELGTTGTTANQLTFSIVGIANASGTSTYDREMATICAWTQHGYLSNFYIGYNRKTGAPLGSCVESLGDRAPIASILYVTSDNVTTYTVTFDRASMWARAQIILSPCGTYVIGDRAPLTEGTALSIIKLTPDRIGAAPASGFESHHLCANVDELNAKIAELTTAQSVGTEKTYYIYLQWHYGIALPTGRWSVTIHKPDVGAESAWAGVTATVVGSQTIYKLHRELYEGTWLDWAWENPPMALGVEYRTTERFDSKAVYTRLIDVGNYPATGSTTWKGFGNGQGITKILRVCGVDSGGVTIPYYEESMDTRISGTVTGDQAYIAVSVIKGNFTAKTCTAQVWYVKN